MRFEWDEAKNAKNQKKHGLAFEDAEYVFEGDVITKRDPRYQSEERYLTVGRLDDVVVVIAHTPRGERTRIISMRKANARERKKYQE